RTTASRPRRFACRTTNPTASRVRDTATSLATPTAGVPKAGSVSPQLSDQARHAGLGRCETIYLDHKIETIEERCRRLGERRLHLDARSILMTTTSLPRRSTQRAEGQSRIPLEAPSQAPSEAQAQSHEEVTP